MHKACLRAHNWAHSTDSPAKGKSLAWAHSWGVRARRMEANCIKHACMLTTGYIAQWLERLTADQQVPGSNPGVPLPAQ